MTNDNNLPEALVKAVESHQHKGGDYSASMMTNPARMYWLTKRHFKKLTKSIDSSIWSLFGTAVHHIIQTGAGDNEIAEGYHEETLEILGNNVTLSGSADIYDNEGNIIDWKTDSVWTIIFGNREHEREVQLNIYAWLYRKAGFEVNAVKVISLLKDWSRKKAKHDREYPQCEVVMKKYKLWDDVKALDYIYKRLTYFESFRNIKDDVLPECTMEERWQDPTIYAVMKEGRKSAVRLYKTMEEAEKRVIQEQEKTKKEHYITIRVSEPKRCIDYCSCNQFCNQYLKAVESGKA
jgi:hypothetical protein